ncbi:MAG: GIY-YIG nuclease family protein [Akkermansiaceae bacterium]
MSSQKSYHVYILKNRMNRRFIGITEDSENELSLHNKGQFKGTKPFKPWQMEWCSGPLSRNDSLRLEESLRHHKTNTAMLESITHKHEMGM